MSKYSEDYFFLKYKKYKAKYAKLMEDLEGGYGDDTLRQAMNELYRQVSATNKELNITELNRAYIQNIRTLMTFFTAKKV